MEPLSPQSIAFQPSRFERKHADTFSSMSHFDASEGTYYQPLKPLKKKIGRVLRKQRVQVQKSPMGLEEDLVSTPSDEESADEDEHDEYFTVEKEKECDVSGDGAESVVGRKRKVGRPGGLEKRTRCR